jgi:hypothetical protein
MRFLLKGNKKFILLLIFLYPIFQAPGLLGWMSFYGGCGAMGTVGNSRILHIYGKKNMI